MKRIKSKKYQDKLHYEKHAGKELRDLYPGKTAISHHDGKWTAVTVVEKHLSPRSYIVQTHSGRKLRRNRRDIRPMSAKQNRSTKGCSKLKRSVDMTSSGKNGLNIRTNASPKWDRARCPEEQASSVG